MAVYVKCTNGNLTDLRPKNVKYSAKFFELETKTAGQR